MDPADDLRPCYRSAPVLEIVVLDPRRACLVLLLAALCVSAPRVAFSEEEALPQVVLLATGGTIAGVSASETASAYEPGTLSVQALMDAVPQLAEKARLRGEQIANIASQDMTDAIWLRLAKRVNALLARDDVDGIVITHGTDTMEETAYFLHLVVKSDKPVVLVGAMRASTSLSADGPMNLYNAVSVAADPDAAGRGVLLVMNDTVHGARAVTKEHTTALETFTSPGTGPLGHVHYGEVRLTGRPARPHTTDTPFDVSKADELPRVDLLLAHANLKGDLVDAMVERGAKGIVLAGVGNGNASSPALAALARAVKEGVAVVRTSRIDAGPVFRNLEIDDDKRGFVAGDTLSPQKARILLMLALAQGADASRLQSLFFRF